MRPLALDDDGLLALLTATARHGGHLVVRVGGDSMAPAITNGDLLVLGPKGAGEPTPGQVVVVCIGGKLLAHRVVTVDSDRIVTRGDACPNDDGAIGREQIVAVVRSVRKRAWWRRVASTWRRTARAGVGAATARPRSARQP